LTEYYFDIETYSTTPKPVPTNDKIITIQYQKLRTETGETEGDLQILTEWDTGSEKNLLDKFRKVFLTGNDFAFIPVGVNIYGYDFIALIHKLNHYFDLGMGMNFFSDRPAIDLKSTLIMMNKGQLKGYNLLLGKKQSGNIIKGLYEAKDYEKILQYIRDEAEAFLSKYQKLKRELPKIDLNK